MKKFTQRLVILATMFLMPLVVSAANLSQTIHFSTEEGKVEVTPKLLFETYLDAKGHQKITGLPVKIQSIDKKMKAVAGKGDQIQAFCFTEDQCGLRANILEIQEGSSAHDTHSIVMSWWNFGWMQALDKEDYTNPQMGDASSIVVLTFKNTKSGAQVELSQINVPDYKVKLQNPDGSVEVGPLSQIVNTHWSTLYWDGLRRHLKTNTL